MAGRVIISVSNACWAVWAGGIALDAFPRGSAPSGGRQARWQGRGVRPLNPGPPSALALWRMSIDVINNCYGVFSCWMTMEALFGGGMPLAGWRAGRPAGGVTPRDPVSLSYLNTGRAFGTVIIAQRTLSAHGAQPDTVPWGLAPPVGRCAWLRTGGVCARKRCSPSLLAPWRTFATVLQDNYLVFAHRETMEAKDGGWVPSISLPAGWGGMGVPPVDSRTFWLPRAESASIEAYIDPQRVCSRGISSVDDSGGCVAVAGWQAVWPAGGVIPRDLVLSFHLSAGQVSRRAFDASRMLFAHRAEPGALLWGSAPHAGWCAGRRVEGVGARNTGSFSLLASWRVVIIVFKGPCVVSAHRKAMDAEDGGWVPPASLQAGWGGMGVPSIYSRVSWLLRTESALLEACYDPQRVWSRGISSVDVSGGCIAVADWLAVSLVEGVIHDPPRV